MNPFKAAVLAVCTPVEQVPLEEPPTPEADLGVATICPQCGGIDPVVKMVDDASVADCPGCGAQFTPRALESEAMQIIQQLTERKRLQRRALGVTPDQKLAAKREAFRLLGV